jgi:hypothetical protein
MEMTTRPMTNEDTVYITIWPDGSWCYDDEFELYSADKSDDFLRTPLPSDVGPDYIDEWISCQM